MEAARSCEPARLNLVGICTIFVELRLTLMVSNRAARETNTRHVTPQDQARTRDTTGSGYNTRHVTPQDQARTHDT